tara:strand:+ start:1199 stop:1969 length:771 start_codon:yes stop_codon:yes gene_type:complete
LLIHTKIKILKNYFKEKKMKLTQLIKENEERPLSSEVKRHFLEIVSTYNKYQESMDRKSDITQVAETLGGITEAARTLAIKEAGDWFDKHTVRRNMNELDKLGKQFDKVAGEARNLDQRMAGLYEDMGHILSRYYKFGEITEDEMKSRLGINETKEEDCGCNEIREQQVTVHNRTSNGNIVTTLKESDLNEQEMKLYEFGKKVTRLMEKNVPTNPSKWAYYKAQAKKKFDVYPSAYANGWAAKQYKAAGGSWKKGK